MRSVRLCKALTTPRVYGRVVVVYASVVVVASVRLLASRCDPCVRVCVCACVRARVCACVRVCCVGHVTE